MIWKTLIVGIGGFIGAACRYRVSTWVQALSGSTTFPAGTMIVNVLGCLVIGLLGGLVSVKNVMHPEMRLLVLTGLLGGFTTFSTFGYETMALVRDAEFMAAGLNVALQLALGFGAVVAGYKLSLLI
jgi:CrcB protein